MKGKSENLVSTCTTSMEKKSNSDNEKNLKNKVASNAISKRGRGRPRKIVVESESSNSPTGSTIKIGNDNDTKPGHKYCTRSIKKKQAELLNSSPIKCVLSHGFNCSESPTMDKMFEHLTKGHEVKKVTYHQLQNWTVYLNSWYDLKKVNVKAFEHEGHIFLHHVLWDSDNVYYWVAIIAEEEVAKKYKFGLKKLERTHGGMISMNLYGQVVSVRESHWPNVNKEEVDEQGKRSSPVISVLRKLIALCVSRRAENIMNGLSYEYSWMECFEIIRVK